MLWQVNALGGPKEGYLGVLSKPKLKQQTQPEPEPTPLGK